MKFPVWTRLLPVATALAGMGALAVLSIRAGWADYRMRQGTVAGLKGAIELMPDQAEYQARLAWLVSEDEPQTANDALLRAVALNPRDAGSWIELGLQAEAKGDDTSSLENLLRATEVDRTFLPRWTLANYYFRHNDPERFWFWAKTAVAMVYGDARPLFRLCGSMEEDGNLIDRLEIRNPEVRAAYLSYLLDKNREDLVAPAINRLLQENRQEDVPLLLRASERLLVTGREDQAARVWNRLADAGRVPFRTLAGEGAQFVANGTFRTQPASQGFDWRLPVVEGISVSIEEPRGLRVTFSGREPEDCEVLTQLVPLLSGGHYQLSFEYRTGGIKSGAGLEWRITDFKNGTVLSDGASLASETEVEGRLAVETPAKSGLVRLSLRYHRTPGTTRVEGFVVVRNVSLRPADQFPSAGSRIRK